MHIVAAMSDVSPAAADGTRVGPFTALLSKFPDLTKLSRQLDLPHSTVAAWKRRDKVPEDRWRDIATAARALKVRGVTFDRFAEAAVERRRRREQAAQSAIKRTSKRAPSGKAASR